MSVEKIIKIVEEEVEREISEILSQANSEKERILTEGKTKIDEEVETQKQHLKDEFSRKLSLEKLFIESEENKRINKVVSEVFQEIYSEVVKEIKSRFLSFNDRKELLLNLIHKSLNSLSNKENIKIILSLEDFKKYGEEIKKELSKTMNNVEVVNGDIEGGVLIRQGNITIDSSVKKIIKMFEPDIVNSIYKALPRVKL